MKIQRQVGTASEVLSVFIQDATVSTGAGLANVVASSVTYGILRNNQATVSSGTCSSGGVLGTYSVSSLTQMSSSLMLGWYQFCPPDLSFFSGGSVAIHLAGAPSMAPVPIEIELTKVNNQTYASSTTYSSIADTRLANLDRSVSSLYTSSMPQSYRTVSSLGTLPQMLYEINQHLGGSAFTVTTKTLNQLDGSAAMTFQLDSSSGPSSINRIT